MSKRVKDNGDGTVTIALKHPVKVDSKTFDSVTLRTVAMVPDLEAMDKGEGDIGKTKHLIAELSSSGDGPGIPLSAFGKMHASDYLVLAKQAGLALADANEDDEKKESLQTGGSS